MLPNFQILDKYLVAEKIQHYVDLYKTHKMSDAQASQHIQHIISHLEFEDDILTDLNIAPLTTEPLQILVLALKYDAYKGKMAVGKINSGSISKNQNLIAVGDGYVGKGRAAALMAFDGLGVKELDIASAGEIVIVAGIDNVSIGDTITTPDCSLVMARVSVDEPTIKMTFGVNTSPLAGKEGKMCTSRQIRERLKKELETNVALKIEDHPESSEKFIVSGRGELHLAVLIETMRREGYELEVSKPEVIFKTGDDLDLGNSNKYEPFENIEIDVPVEHQGVVMQELGKRSADIEDIYPNETGTEVHFDAKIPTRGLIGLKSFLITETKGTVIMNSTFDDYKPLSNFSSDTRHGSLVSTEAGTSMAYALDNAQQRGTLFVGAAVEVYVGMVIGACAKDSDLDINPCKGKAMSNVRSKSSDDQLTLIPIKPMSLENCLEYIADDELVEVTPKNLRIRKRHLDPNDRKRGGSSKR